MPPIRSILSLVIGIAMIIATASGAFPHEEQSRGYILGSLLIVFGVIRFALSSRR